MHPNIITAERLLYSQNSQKKLYWFIFYKFCGGKLVHTGTSSPESAAGLPVQCVKDSERTSMTSGFINFYEAFSSRFHTNCVYHYRFHTNDAITIPCPTCRNFPSMSCVFALTLSAETTPQVMCTLLARCKLRKWLSEGRSTSTRHSSAV